MSRVLHPTRYHAEMHFRTGGLAAVFWKSRIDAAAEGSATSEALVPDFYTSRSLSRNATQQTVRVEYGGKGAPVMTASPPYDLSRYPVTDAQKRGAIDPVTAISSIIAGLSASEREPCGRTLAIFDGRRRYDVVFTFAREELDGAKGIGLHPRVCKAEYRHIAGIQQDVVDVASVPEIYAIFVDVPAGSRRYTVARTLWSSFLWGAVKATLSAAKIDGRSLALEP